LQPCLGYSQWRRFENAIQKDKNLANVLEMIQAISLPALATQYGLEKNTI
jgi:hypothetical protein